jgi:GT2 family glycosyltransferase
LTGQFQALARNRLLRIVAGIRKAKFLQPLHKHYGPIKYDYVLPALQRLKNLFGRPEVDLRLAYQLWARRCEQLRYNQKSATERLEHFAYRPVISILMPVFDPQPEHLGKAIDSVVNQYYSAWELCICDDASTRPQIQELLKRYAEGEGRIRMIRSEINGGIASASNRALALASGEFIGLLDHDDELTPDALLEIVAVLQETDADVIYSDEDRLDAKGQRTEPAFKPAWSPDLLLSCMYMAHFCVYRKRLLDSLKGFGEGFDGSQDYDLALRATEVTEKIAHIPKILYHWRKVSTSTSALAQARPAVTEAGRRALQEALNRRHIDGDVYSESHYGFYRVRRAITEQGRVSIIIPTRDGLQHLRRCLDSLEARTAYRNYEIIIVDNGSQEEAMLAYLRAVPHRVIRDAGPFNFSRLNNLAARESEGLYLLFLNDDTEVISKEWLDALIEQGARKEVGAVGAKLLYKDGRLQHAGIVLGLKGVANHAHRYLDGFNGKGYLNYPNVIRNYSAVSAACLLMRREVFNEVGGFDEVNLPVSFNDVDLGLRLRQQGYLISYTPYALLYHHESATRGYHAYPQEEAFMRRRWMNALQSDPYYNPNLTLAKEDFSVDFAKPESLVCVLSQESDGDIVGRLDGQTSLGQEFVVEPERLGAIGVRLEKSFSFDQGVVRLHLQASTVGSDDLAVAEMRVTEIVEGGWSVFCFAAPGNFRGRKLYFFLELLDHPKGGLVELLGAKSVTDRAPQGYKNHQPAGGNLAFKIYSLTQFRYAESSAKSEATGDGSA